MDESAEDQDWPEDVGPKLSWDEIREHVERHVRRYAAASVVDLALADLWAQSDEENARLKRFLWLTLVVAKWSLLLADTLHVGDKMPAGLLAYLKQKLWDGGDQAFKERIARVWAVTTPDLALVRLHGNNEDTWSAKGLLAASARFN